MFITSNGNGLSNEQALQLAAASRRQPVENISALRALTNQQNGDIVYVAGTISSGDGGGGYYQFNSNSIATDNQYSIIVPNTGGGRWHITQANSKTWVGTQTQYDAILTKGAGVIYIIIQDQT